MGLVTNITNLIKEIAKDIKALQTPAPGENLLINGMLNLWQRGTSQTVSGYASDDHWSNNHVGSTGTHSQQAFAAGQTDVPDNPAFYSRTAVSSVAGASNYSYKAQAIEDVRTLANTSVTFVFYAKADAAKNIAVEMRQYFGDNGSSAVTGINKVFTLSTGWARYEVTFKLPSVSGKTIGANSFTSLYIWFEAGSNVSALAGGLGQQSGTFDLAHLKLERGTVATAWKFRTYAQELWLAQRYFELVKGTIQTTSRFRQYKFSATKRIIPAMGLWSGNLGGSSTDANGLSVDGFRTAAVGSGEYDFVLSADAEIPL